MSSLNLSRFPTACRKIMAVGKNYADHAAEMGGSVPKKPMLFMKPSSCIIEGGQKIVIPEGCEEVHHEIELGVLINEDCSRVNESDSMKFVGGYVLALDMTARDFQAAAKKAGHPWTLAKGFDTSCPVSPFIPLESIPDPHNVNLLCSVNDQQRQNGNTKDMIFNIPHLISYISKYFKLQAGDLILTGTPAGVGPVKPGDIVYGEIPGVVKMEFGVE